MDIIASGIASALAGLHAMELKNVLDCSTNPNYPAATNGDTYCVSVAGKVGGASGVTVSAGDLVVCVTTNAGGTQAAVGSSWGVVQANVQSVFGRNGAVTATAGDYTGVAVGGTADAVASGAITNAMVNASAAIAVSKLADPTTGKVIGSASNAAAAVFPPGYELNYTAITSTANITDTSEATATALISPGAITFDGAPVLVTFFTSALQPPTTLNGFSIVTLFEASTEICRLAVVLNPVAGVTTNFPVTAQFRFTPTAGAHTYKICGVCSATTGTPNIAAGGGTSTPPAFVRFTKI